MLKNIEKLNIVDENGEIIGEDTRANIHAKGLLHREVAVIFFTPEGDIIFQERSKTKDMNPGMLTIAVGGHVNLNETYDQTVVKEIKEETGLDLDVSDLVVLDTIRQTKYDPLTGNTNNIFKKIYAYYYQGKIEDLKIEVGEIDSFQKYNYKELMSGNFKKEENTKFAPDLLDAYREEFEKIEAIINQER